MDYTLDEVKTKLKVHNLKVERKQLRRRVKQYVVLVELMQDSLDEADRTITSLNALAESNKIAIDSLKEEIERSNGLVDELIFTFTNLSTEQCNELVDRIQKEREGNV